MTDPRNIAVPTGLTPIAVGLLVILIDTGFGFNSAYAINRLATSGIGVVGGWPYDACVGNRFPESARP